MERHALRPEVAEAAVVEQDTPLLSRHKQDNTLVLSVTTKLLRGICLERRGYKVEIAVEFRRMSLGNFRASQHTVQPPSHPITVRPPAGAHPICLPPSVFISI
ncbi:hypothetical protein EYF80_028763 [Liparis tanakae]|uniref:Uncharacterized protein n=1 Tax=Liparis tanakae TaxID=230148 RepID=A0A4Z2H6V8_9TELE|nr:hypothetical protein EYF80_028763 [Liparis tanakae]